MGTGQCRVQRSGRKAMEGVEEAAGEALHVFGALDAPLRWHEV